LFNNIYKNKRVFITGHTGFKGSWLAFWLKQLGAKVYGYSLEPPIKCNHYRLLNLNIQSTFEDIRDHCKLSNAISSFKPDIVFHLAAQALVRLSYNKPIKTLETNIIGTANVFDVCRFVPSIKAIVNITSDKCYDNKEWVWSYRENDQMGGYDPYSVSKGCSELITSSYRNSFFNLNDYGLKHNVLLASCRAGNVIGGGDWADDRLIPDIMKAANKGKTVDIRNPHATRPWQHVLEPLSGYLSIGQKLFEGKKEFADGWNFGPGTNGNLSVKILAERLPKYWNKIKFNVNKNLNTMHEAGLLKLDCSKAYNKLLWRGVWDTDTTLMKTIAWYKSYYENKVVNTGLDLNTYISDATKINLSWTK